MSFRTISALMRGTWLINREYVYHNQKLVSDLRSGKPVDFGITERELAEKEAKLSLSAFKRTGSTLAFNVSPYTDLERIPEGSIAVIGLVGPLLKYGDGCSYGMADKSVLLERIAASGKFKAVVMDVDTPGGQTDGTQQLADTILYLPIPVVAVVNDGMMASAGMWIGSACAEIYATKKTDMFGSIGVYFTMYDFTKYLEEQGIEIIEVYADPSTEKNNAYKKALEGDVSLIKEEVNFICAAFHEYVKAGRGARLNVAAGDPFTGKMFPAEKALEIGLIDGIKSMNEVFARAAELGDQNNSVTPNNQNNMFGLNSFKGISALKGVAASALTEAHITAANADIEKEGIEGVTLVLDTELETAANAVTANTSALSAINAALGEGNHKATLGEAVSALIASHKTATGSVATLTTERDNWKGKAEEYGAKPADESTNGNKDGDDKIETTTTPVASTYSQADADLAALRKSAGFKPKATK